MNAQRHTRMEFSDFDADAQKAGVPRWSITQSPDTRRSTEISDSGLNSVLKDRIGRAVKLIMLNNLVDEQRWQTSPEIWQLLSFRWESIHADRVEADTLVLELIQEAVKGTPLEAQALTLYQFIVNMDLKRAKIIGMVQNAVCETGVDYQKPVVSAHTHKPTLEEMAAFWDDEAPVEGTK